MLTAEDVERLVNEELAAISNDALRKTLARFRILPQVFRREWDHGTGAETSWWLCAEFSGASAGLAYSEAGHGRIDHWGIVTTDYDDFGSDSAWFLTLEEAFLQSGLWEGAISDPYDVR